MNPRSKHKPAIEAIQILVTRFPSGRNTLKVFSIIPVNNTLSYLKVKLIQEIKNQDIYMEIWEGMQVSHPGHNVIIKIHY